MATRRFKRICALAAGATVLAAAPASSGEPGSVHRRQIDVSFLAQDAPPESPAARGSKEAPAPASDEFDWVQLTNGEWVKGEIVELLDDTFVFDSDEFGEREIDWDDVAAVYSSRFNRLGLRDRTIVRGAIVIEDDLVRVTPPEGEPIEFDRSQLRTIVPGQRTLRGLWSGRLSLGTTQRSGNVDQLDISGLVRLERRDVYSRLRFEYTGEYGEVDGGKTANQHTATLTFDRYLSDRYFWRVIGLTGFRDEFQNIDYRFTPSTSIGYDVIDTSRTEWTVNAGFGWQFTRFIDPAEDEDDYDDSAAVILGSRFEYEINSRVDVGAEFDMTLLVPETNDFNSRVVLWAEIEIIEDFDIDVRWTWDRQNNPVEGDDGDTPDRDDFRLYVGVGWSF